MSACHRTSGVAGQVLLFCAPDHTSSHCFRGGTSWNKKAADTNTLPWCSTRRRHLQASGGVSVFASWAAIVRLLSLVVRLLNSAGLCLLCLESFYKKKLVWIGTQNQVKGQGRGPCSEIAQEEKSKARTSPVVLGAVFERHVLPFVSVLNKKKSPRPTPLLTHAS